MPVKLSSMMMPSSRGAPVDGGFQSSWTSKRSPTGVVSSVDKAWLADEPPYSVGDPISGTLFDDELPGVGCER